MPLAAVQIEHFVLVAGMILLCAILIYRSRKRLAASAAARPQSPVAAPPVPNLLALRRRLDSPEIDRYEVEIQDMVRDVRAEIDSKMIALAQLIRMAAEESARLEELLQRAGELSEVAVSLRETKPG
ncbi:MAG: hypothetical protein HYS13_26050 [Planctomycetia bacterium]|nr:hypothetical protein [Planctomycetia bacterium]